MVEYRNMLEPPSLIEAFLTHPPEHFEIHTIPYNGQDIHGFFADLDLFTTLEDSAKNAIDRLRRLAPIDWFIKRYLTPNVLFIGTTVSEYCWLPKALDFDAFTQAVMEAFARAKRQFLIIKDIPGDSPLLGRDDNRRSAELLAFLKASGFIILTGQALAYLPIAFDTIDGYLQPLSSNRRKDFRRKMKIGANLNMQELSTGDPFFSDAMVAQLYALYVHTYDKSDLHFDKLTFAFFDHLLRHSTDGTVFIYRDQNHIIGFNLCYVVNGALVDKYAGSRYPEAFDAALFFNNSFDNIRYCLAHGLTTYIMGWTEPKTKATLGCRFTYTHHAVYIKHPLLRFILSWFQSRFEGDKSALTAMEMPHA